MRDAKAAYQTLQDESVRLLDEGDLDGAEPLVIESLERAQKLFGVKHAEVADCTYNLGSLHRRKGRLPEAVTTLEKAHELQASSRTRRSAVRDSPRAARSCLSRSEAIVSPMRSVRTTCVILGLVACGSHDERPPVTVKIEPLPSATASSSSGIDSSRSGAPLACGHFLPGAPIVLLPERTPVNAGQMTEDSASAKRLFDRERWADATAALERVASGQTGDDQGNRELAQYHEAIALYRLHRARDAARIFVEMARDRGHLKHAESILWIGKLVAEMPDLVRTLAAYRSEDIARFDNPNQRELFWTLSFLAGRERVERGERAEASAFFARVDPASAYAPLAQACVAQLH